jgi:5-methylcytosine-specific restriction endonuclease McrA
VSGGRALRQAVHNRAKGKCHYCGRIKGLLTVDHVVPLAQGGTWHITNLVGACSECNSHKGQLSEEEFRRDVLPRIMARRAG